MGDVISIPVSFVSRLPHHDIAVARVMESRKFGVDTSSTLFGGARLGFYFLATGAVARASKVIYDSSHSAIAEIEPGMINWEEDFPGATWIHWTGSTPGLS